VTTVLLAEDDAAIAEPLSRALQREGYEVAVAADGLIALEHVRGGGVDLLVLDLGLPGMDGLEVCRRIRAKSRVPILMLTAKGDETDRVVGLELGADDYIAKPFSPNELVARVRALLRRAHRQLSTSGPIRYGSIVVDSEQHTVSSDEHPVSLTAKEFLLLQYLLKRRGRVLSRDVLLTDVWGYKYTGGTRTVDVHVRRLREKLPALAEAIVTVKQFGYKLLDPPPGNPA